MAKICVISSTVNLIKTNNLSKIDPNVRETLSSNIKLLAKWSTEFHKKNVYKSKELKGLIVLNKGDVRLRDFIANTSDNLIYGVDFENAYKGNHLDDLSGLCCALLDTSPGIFEKKGVNYKFSLIKLFLKEYYRLNDEFISFFNDNYFAKKVINNIRIVIKRRKLNDSILNWKKLYQRVINLEIFNNT